MSNDCIPYYEDGDHLSAICEAPVAGKTFVKVAGNRSGGVFNPAAINAGDGGVTHIATADVGGRSFGVAAYDGANGQIIEVIRGAKMVIPVTAGGPLSAFDEVAVGSNGTAVATGADTAATLVTGTVLANNAILWTSVDGGVVGNSYSVALLNPGANNAALSIAVNGDEVEVNLATGVAGAITSTAAQVIAAIAAYEPTSDFPDPLPVTAANDSTSTGAGVVAAVAQTSLANGAEATGSGKAQGYVLADCASGADAQVSLY